MKAILGRKIDITRIFDKDGKTIPISIIEADDCVITQIKKQDKDGYDAAQIGFIKLNDKHQTKTRKYRQLKEFKVKAEEILSLKIGDSVKVNLFKPGDLVKVSGFSKGKGFQGTVKRHHFTTGPKTHGSDNYRQPGSIGATYPQRTIKGRRMAGHMGRENVSVRNVEVIDIISDKNLLLLKGPIPGIKGSVVAVVGK